MIRLMVNGQSYDVDVEPDTPLLWAIRENVGLTGTKYGCGIAQCGACTVDIDGTAVRSCSLPASEAAGKKITTIEGLAQNGKLHPVQQAWLDLDIPQCGYCQSGMIMAVAGLLKDNPKPTTPTSMPPSPISVAAAPISGCGRASTQRRRRRKGGSHELYAEDRIAAPSWSARLPPASPLEFASRSGMKPSRKPPCRRRSMPGSWCSRMTP